MNDLNQHIPKTYPIVIVYSFAAALIAAGLIIPLPTDAQAVLLALGLAAGAIATGELFAKRTITRTIRNQSR